MLACQAPMHEIDSAVAFKTWLASGPARKPAAVQAVDLSGETIESLSGRFDGALFLGCPLGGDAVASHLVAQGAAVLPVMPRFKFKVHRAFLYEVEELFAGFEADDPASFERTLDHQIYAQYLQDGKANPTSIQTSLARRMHDHSITDALMETIEGRKVVAVMGGHGMKRGDAFYGTVARVSRTLTRRGYLLVSGGGPGAMEATHVGAYFAARADADLDTAIEQLAVRPAGATQHEYQDKDWLHRAMAVRDKFPIPEGKEDDCLSVGIPTWLYGHEPPAPFATRIAKYFANSVREDGLLAIAKHGVIYAPGSAGTTQEVFQDAAQNHYGSMGFYSPMIMLGRDYWTNTRPVWPLLETVSRGKTYGELVCLTDDEDAVVRRIRSWDPDVYAAG